MRSPLDLDEYTRVLVREIRHRVGRPADTLYLGGGTPSLMNPRQLAALMEALDFRRALKAGMETTLESNPATISGPALREFRRLGVNRISLGVQSTQDAYVRLLGRAHDAAQARRAFQAARRAGFENIACDLIYGLPKQTFPEFRQDLDALLAWRPDHISLYALTLEPGTPLHAKISRGELPAPEEDLAADMYTWARERLAGSGYVQYELSNFCLAGRESRHNLLYWTDQPYLGLGAAAHSYSPREFRRSWNHSDIHAYRSAVRRRGEALAGEEIIKGKVKLAETLIMNLRVTAGVGKPQMIEKFGVEWEAQFHPALERLREQGLVENHPERVRLTPRGMLLSNLVFRELL